MTAKSRTFAEILDAYGGAGPGFDLLRLALAVSILASHCASIGHTAGFFPSLAHFLLGFIGRGHAQTLMPGAAAAPTVHWGAPLALSHVPMFFALSGFLVTGSAFRTKRVLPFLALRFLRIFPALCVEVTLSAIVIGAVFTVLPLGNYYTSRLFISYFGNIAGIVQMVLPGVTFYNGGTVNANLWTLPGEFHCYLLLAALMIVSIIFNRRVATTLFAIATGVLLVANFAFGYHASPGDLSGDINVYYFYCGSIFFLWRDSIRYNALLCAGSVCAVYGLMFWAHGVYLAPLPLTYITVFLGLTAFPQFRFVRSGDYSYGIYLYGFPISQVLATVFPALRGNYLALFSAALLCTGLFAMASWHLVEKHFLKLRRFFSPKSARIAEELHPEVFSDTKTETDSVTEASA